jgi:hypothetical protein
LQRIPYFPKKAQKLLGKYDAFVLVGANEPVAFFGYADGVTFLLPDKAQSVRLDNPPLDWISLSRGMGVPAASVNTAEAFACAFRTALQEPGPYLIEAILEG